MRTIILSCFLFLNLVCGLALKAQINPQPHFRNYSTEHGLPSPEVYTAFQDSKGYMWFGTDNGASRFDGYEFKNYGAKQGLNSNVVFDIFEDEEQNIWFGTMTGEAFLLQEDTIVPYPYNHLVLQYRDQFHDAALAHLTQDKSAFFELTNLGILSIDSSGHEQLTTSQQPSSRLVMEVPGTKKILRTYVRRYGDSDWKKSLQYQHQTNTFNLEVIGQQKVFQKYLPNSSKGNVVEFRAFKAASGELLVFYQQRLYCLKNQELVWVKPWDYPINEVVQDAQLTFWLCVGEGGGLRRFQNLEALKNEKYDLYLGGLSISNVLRDKQGGFWVTSQERGIFYCSNNNLTFYGKNIGLSDNFISTVDFRSDTAIYVGCQNGDIYLLDFHQNILTDSISNPWGYHNYDMLYVPEVDRLWSNGAYWESGQWNYINQMSWTVNKSVPLLLHKLDNLQVTSEGMMIGCHSIGHFILDIDKLQVIFNPSTNRKLGGRTFAVHMAENKRLWIGKLEGLFEVRDSVLIHPKIEHPAFHSRVEDIDEFPDSSLVFGTKGWGVVVWKGEYFSIISEEDGLTTNMIEDVHVDDDGLLWIGTLNGLNKVTFDKRGEPIIQQFTIAHGLPSNEIYRIKSFKGQVWLCTAGGLVKFQETEAEQVSIAPIIQSIEINGKDQTSEDLLRVSHRNNNFVFQYLTLNYKQNGNIQYRFRLHQNDDWSYTKNRTANYPALPPDQYRFEIQSSNEDGLWSNSTIQYFTIAPPWWATSWFIILISLSFIASSFGIFQYRLQQLRKRSLVQQQISDLEKSALQAQMNPHFIFNCLNSIQNFILQHNSQKAVDFLSRFARLVRLHLNASMDGYISLEEEISLLDNYLILEQERFDHKFQFQLELDPSIEPDQIQIPPLLIQPFVENAIVHGMANKQKDGRIQIKFLKKDEHLQVTIRDNGKDQDLINNNQKSHDYKSVGMSITQKRLQLMDQSQTEVLEITSIQEQDPQIEGTLVTILIKYQSL